MTRIRLLPIVILVTAALLVLKTMGLATNGGYVLAGIGTAQAAGGGAASHGGTVAQGETITMPSEPTIKDATPTLADKTVTLGAAPATGGHGGGEARDTDAAPATETGEAGGAHELPTSNSTVAENACAPRPVSPPGTEATGDGQLLVLPGDCPPLQDGAPQLATAEGVVPLSNSTSSSEQALLERLAGRRSELDAYAQELSTRAALVEAAEKRMEERQAALQVIEDQIASLVEQRKQMEEGQFASIVAMYETMKPKDAAKIFDNLEMDVLLRVSKLMNPRKLAPILAAMTTTRAQDLTVRMASASDDPLEGMSPDDLAALPQIIGQ